MTEQFKKMLIDVPNLVDWHIKRFGRKNIKDRDDLVQNVRLRLLKYPPDLTKYKPTTCITTAIRHAIYDDLRRKDKVENITIEDYNNDPSYNHINNCIDVHNILRNITTRERKVIKAYFGIGQKEKSAREIAKKMNRSKPIVHTLIQRGLSQARTKYHEEFT